MGEHKDRHSRLSAFLRFSPPAPAATAARFTAFVPPEACTPTATLESAVPSGDGETWRSFGEDVPFSDVREEADVDVE